MESTMTEELTQIIQEHALPFSGIDINYDELSKQFKIANIVLLVLKSVEN